VLLVLELVLAAVLLTLGRSLFNRSTVRCRLRSFQNWILRLTPWFLLHRCGIAVCGLTGIPAGAAVVESAELPNGIAAVWDLDRAYRDTSSTRERICLNGLWQWQPAEAQAKQVPVTDWGYFKVPGCWPGITDYMQKDCQTVFPHAHWQNLNLAGISAAWYQRQITVPTAWDRRRVFLSVEYLNSFAAVYLDGKPAGELRFPGGELDLTSWLKSGGTHRLSLCVVALPLKAVMRSYTDSAAAREQKGAVARRGLGGDVFLVGTTAGPRISNLRTDTSFRKKELSVSVALENLEPDKAYSARMRVLQNGIVVRDFKDQPVPPHSREGQFSFAHSWLPTKLWDLNTPTNQYDLEFCLLDNAGAVLDEWWRTRFGFRELWIEGKDFFLNGSRVFLSAVPLDNAQISAATATYGAARESLERLKVIGINFVYTHNYGCEPGAHLAFNEILRAADDVGMLVSFSQPHFSHYDWKASDADSSNGYATHAAFYVRAAQNHPSVVFYSMSHNATGYDEDMNPDLIDGKNEARDSWALKNVALAMRAEAIVHRLDPGRIIYHHASGNLSSMHAINFYPNFVPIQELSDWFGHWSTEGVKPVFLCEYGAPFTWDWTLYRGWYKGQREFGSAAVPWEFCLAEWNSQFVGDKAFAISDAEKANLRWEAEQFRAGKVWHRWDYPVEVGSTRFQERYPVFAMYLKDNWRAFRTWQVSAFSPWEFEHFWRLREGVDRKRKDYRVDWSGLQRPGFSPDYEDQRFERMDLAYERSDWVPTVAAQELLANNGPVLAYLAGKPEAFTSKDHIFYPGERVSKEFILINNSRRTVDVDAQWSVSGLSELHGSTHLTIPTGQQARFPIAFEFPAATTIPGPYELSATAKFSTGEIMRDRFLIDTVPQPVPKGLLPGKIALFDPPGETAKLLRDLGMTAEPVGAEADLSNYDLLLIGKAALTVAGPGPDIRGVKDGLKVVVFEQSSAVLEKRLGFRVEEYGLRQVFPRIPDHPALKGLAESELKDWRGESTITPAKLSYIPESRYGPTVQWCGLTVPHLWRCGNRGNVASVLIEKPALGDFLPILDGGFGLQYSPLLEYREGQGMVLFCQVDVTARTESEPAAQILVRNLLEYAMAWRPPVERRPVYVGDPQGKRHLESIGLAPLPFQRSNLNSHTVLVLGPSCASQLSDEKQAIASWLGKDGRIVALGLEGAELSGLLPFEVTTSQAEHIAAFFKAPGLSSVFAGLSPADLHDRDPRALPLISAGAELVGDGVLGEALDGRVVLMQMTPWQFSDALMNQKRTRRHLCFGLSRVLANQGLRMVTPLLQRFGDPVVDPTTKNRCLAGLYLDTPEAWDDPYRHFRW
jgi:beta-galactosidase